MLTNSHVPLIGKITHVRLLTEMNILSIGPSEIQVRPKLVAVLELLIENQSGITLREELLDKIWSGNRFTYSQGATHAICQLRKLLTSFVGEGIQIKTISKKGYCLNVDRNLVYIDSTKLERADSIWHPCAESIDNSRNVDSGIVRESLSQID